MEEIQLIDAYYIIGPHKNWLYRQWTSNPLEKPEHPVSKIEKIEQS